MLQSAEFWVGVAFVIFWGVMFYFGVPGKVMNQLDSRGKRIADELAEAKRLRQDAERLLKEYESKRVAFEHSAPVAGLYSIGRNGEFAHVLMEDVYWRTVRRMRQLVATL